jgi:hypothetical protein
LTEEPDYYRFAKYVTERILDEFSGHGIVRRIGDKPSRSGIFIGTLLPRQPLSGKGVGPGRAMPTEVGIELLIPSTLPPGSEVEIELSASFFYRVFPTLDEQKVRSVQLIESEEDELEQENSENQSSEEIKRVFKKTGPHRVSIRMKVDDILKEGKTGIDIIEAADISKSAMNEFSSDPGQYRSRRFISKTLAEKQMELRIPCDVLGNEDDFTSYLRTNFAGRLPTPSWANGARIRATPFGEDRIKLSLVFQNRTEERTSKDDIDNSMFETLVRIHPVGFTFANFILDEIEEEHRFENRLSAIGINCVTFHPEGSDWIETMHSPCITQYRHQPIFFKEATLTELATDPIIHLTKLEENMKKHMEKMKDPNNFADLTEQGRFRYQEEIEHFETETRRFSNGLKVLRKVPEALEAFKLTNESFATCSKGFGYWFRYQIVFLVGLLPDLVAPRHSEFENYREQVDVIYFPTGGGKTETYLSAVVFQMFFDRLNGKKSGISAITKFPLRLLSLQQIQRIADIFGAAEKLRRSHPLIGKKGYDPFSTGYYVGEKNTPNKLYKPRGREGEEEVDEITPVIRGDPKASGFKIITRCPFCGHESIDLTGDLNSVRIKLICKSCKEELPVYVSDEEVYRFLPTFIVSTLDKMAIAGWNSHFKHLFGQVTQKCPDHGYLSNGKCLYQGYGNLCKRKPEEYERVSLDDPTPSILIQDEMHLVRESLGAYDSHYETFLENLQSGLTDGTKTMKIITATATISHFEDQVKHLYMKKSGVFPSRGITRTESFYAREEHNKPARLIIGILPHGRTMIHSVLDIIKTYYMVTRKIERDPQEIIRMGIANEHNVQKLLAIYRFMLSYNLKKMQGDAVGFSINTMVNDKLKTLGFEEICYEPLTGEVTFADVRRVLESIEHPKAGQKLDLITATSMISHGVDIDNLNFMVFQGMPSSTAEYIQAQSRVGRRFPGIVFVIFDHMRERDVSYYKYFYPYHELRDLLIDPVPINRWAKFSIDRTLPGIFSASILNYFDPMMQKKGFKRLYMTKDFKKAMDSGALTENEIIEFLLKSYKVKEEDIGYHFEEFIRTIAKRYIGDALSSTKDQFLPFALSNAPLSNLRDIDIQIEIARSAESFEPMEQLGGYRYAEED